MADIIVHYGVKGMKWGVRRYQNKDGSLTPAGKARERTKNEKRSRSELSRNRRTASLEELTKQINRLEAEKKLKSLIDEDIKPGRTMVAKILKSSGSKVLSGAVAGGIAYAVHYALTKEFDPNDFANYISSNPNKKK